mmetsp:Transcript_17589/g.43443  ORF Transcript_17589/g.43443 Transcript_17589/m.43443 type:complete len:197 (-) Transcript_17589:1211-1801(-)
MGCPPSRPPPPPRYNKPQGMAGQRPQPGAYSQYHEQARAAFVAGDINKDGVLDPQELYTMLCHMGFFNGVPPHEINERMEAHLMTADAIQMDRRITFDEFVPYFEYLLHEMQRRGAVLRPPAQPQQFYGQPGYAVNYGQPGYGQQQQQQQQIRCGPSRWRAARRRRWCCRRRCTTTALWVHWGALRSATRGRGGGG